MEVGIVKEHGGWGKRPLLRQDKGTDRVAFKESIELAVVSMRPLLTLIPVDEGINSESNNSMEGDVMVGYSEKFHDAMRSRGRRVSTVDGDGYCLFHAVAVGLGRPGKGMEVFEEVLSVLEDRKEELRDFVVGSVEEYLERLKGGYGDEINLII